MELLTNTLSMSGYVELADLVIHPVMFAESCYSLGVGRTVSG